MAGDFLEAYDWEVLEEAKGVLRVRAHLPEHVKNPSGQLFGGFTPTYVDLVALLTVRAGERVDGEPRFRNWLATTNMRIDYFEPVVDDFIIDSRLVVKRGRTNFVETRFFDPSEKLCVFAVTTLREVALNRPLGDG